MTRPLSSLLPLLGWTWHEPDDAFPEGHATDDATGAVRLSRRWGPTWIDEGAWLVGPDRAERFATAEEAAEATVRRLRPTRADLAERTDFREVEETDSGDEGLGVPCEGCPSPAVTRDSMGTPLCGACFDALPIADEPCADPDCGCEKGPGAPDAPACDNDAEHSDYPFCVADRQGVPLGIVRAQHETWALANAWEDGLPGAFDAERIAEDRDGPDAHEDEEDDRHAMCPTCGEQAECDEDRCCLTCGRDLIIVADGHSAEMLTMALEETRADAHATPPANADRAQVEALARHGAFTQSRRPCRWPECRTVPDAAGVLCATVCSMPGVTAADRAQDDVLDESLAVCRALGIDTSRDYDLVATARAIVVERDTAVDAFHRMRVERDAERARADELFTRAADAEIRDAFGDRELAEVVRERDALAARLAELEEALAPFAAYSDTLPVWPGEETERVLSNRGVYVTMPDLRRARAALNPTET